MNSFAKNERINEILEVLNTNKLRTFLTAFGVFGVLQY